tara:strand:+ start:407 stop:907 length:501 start_codon:yes stop_codon:yes gene_type:complete
MGIETRYDYNYYTVLGVENIVKLLSEAGTADEMMDTLTLEEVKHIWIDSLNKVFKDNKDYTVNNFRVDDAWYCDDISHWCHRNMQHKECPVFIQYNDKQTVKVEGVGYIFSLYEELDQCDNGYEDELLSQRYNGDETRYNYEVHGIAPPDIDEGCVDGLAGLGGRL